MTMERTPHNIMNIHRVRTAESKKGESVMNRLHSCSSDSLSLMAIPVQKQKQRESSTLSRLNPTARYMVLIYPALSKKAIYVS